MLKSLSTYAALILLAATYGCKPRQPASALRAQGGGGGAGGDCSAFKEDKNQDDETKANELKKDEFLVETALDPNQPEELKLRAGTVEDARRKGQDPDEVCASNNLDDPNTGLEAERQLHKTNAEDFAPDALAAGLAEKVADLSKQLVTEGQMDKAKQVVTEVAVELSKLEVQMASDPAATPEAKTNAVIVGDVVGQVLASADPAVREVDLPEALTIAIAVQSEGAAIDGNAAKVKELQRFAAETTMIGGGAAGAQENLKDMHESAKSTVVDSLQKFGTELQGIGQTTTDVNADIKLESERRAKIENIDVVGNVAKIYEKPGARPEEKARWEEEVRSFRPKR